MICCGLWFNRNLRDHQQQCRDYAEVLSWVSRLLLEFQNIHAALRVEGSAGSGTVKMSWVPPPLGALKLNTDAAVFKEGKAFGIGAVIRGCKGNVVVAAALWFPRCFSVEVGEAVACRERLHLAV
ncbi:hypothetical protein ACOSQ3_008180 [Xanthoceras sorbifolium]